ncbi:MAG: hypothetical protein M5U01_41300 [Ardenticatenaceae bacterium]|nr:hypothetical protein [Ardenticatenaceae bacterium]
MSDARTAPVPSRRDRPYDPHHVSGKEAGARAGGRGPRRSIIFLFLWLVTTLWSVWQLLQGQHGFDTPAALPALLALLACTMGLLWWLPGPVVEAVPGSHRTGRVRFLVLALAGVIGLVLLRLLVGRPLLFALPGLALLVLAAARVPLRRQQLLYALGLALLAGVAGLGAGWISFVSPTVWASLQVTLVLTGLLAGWGVLARTGLLRAGVGRSRFLSEGAASAASGFALGIVLGTPWALGNVLLGAANEEQWVQAWWQPLIAVQPGIAEEAWGRVLLVPLLFLMLRRTARVRIALHAAVLILAYWFAYLHTSGSFDAISTLLIGTLYVLPITYLWLRQGLEVAIGFHFWIDLVKFAAAYLLNTGLWGAGLL